MVHELAHRFAAFPSASGGLALGIASLSWLWQTRLGGQGTVEAVGAVAAAAIIVCLALKFLLNPCLFRAEIAHPVGGPPLVTATMATMVISRALPPGGLAGVVWFAAMVVHGALLVALAARWLEGFRLARMLPSWFLPPVGLVVAVLTMPDPRFAGFAKAILCLGLAAYLAMLPFMLHRLARGETLPEAVKPTFAILAAPPNLCLAAYLGLDPHPGMAMVLPLLTLGLVMTLAVYVRLPGLLRQPFTPLIAVLNFPMVISSTALFRALPVLADHGLGVGLLPPLGLWAGVELAIATLVVATVVLRYALHYGGVVPVATLWPRPPGKS